MAFDQSTRKKLQNFVLESREVLSLEFNRQMQNLYGMEPKSGKISDMGKLTELSDQERQTALLLRSTFEHYLANSPKTKDKEIIDRIVREQSFTILNRLCAVRMAEARGIIIETIGNGHNSKGFQLYSRVAGTAIGDTGETYKQYLMSLFDEFSLDLAVLFDRYSPMGRLFPKDTVLQEIINKINHEDIVSLWIEDETIGWIYQYFNSIEERKKMRKESSAPRNSRELAVRNQFFTPRYVVEFLTDNTLGRTWYEMTKGKTGLVETCEYLVRRPNEVFMDESEIAPAVEGESEDLSQEELLKQTVYIEHRPIKDPRNILMLDPACGSMHFGLYAFDLFELIYSEAWDLFQEGRVEYSNKDSSDFYKSYCNKEEFLKDVPRLIIENNIHGIDIDPRAVQIAGLSLWLRAQKTWKTLNIKAMDRPAIIKSNIVCAEPMPGEKALLKDFCNELQPKVLGQLLEIVFEKMELAGEAGSLLKIEEEIEEAIENARKDFEKEMLWRKKTKGDMFPETLAVRETSLFDFEDMPDKTTFWETAEKQILDALRGYAEHAELKDNSKRLFAEDAAKGFAFIDISRKKYDVVLMNPPFGSATIQSSNKLKQYAIKNLYSCFIERANEITHLDGAFAAITDSTYLKQPSFIKLRELLLGGIKRLHQIVDLGWDVLDANVRTSLLVCHRFNRGRFDSLDISDIENRSLLLSNACKKNSFIIRSHIDTLALPKSVLALNIPVESTMKFIGLRQIRSFAALPWGCGSNDSFRLFRLRWEVGNTDIGTTWAFLTNGGVFSPLYRENYFVCRVIVENGDSAFTTRIKNETDTLYDASAQELYLEPGLTYPKRSRFFHLSALPAGHIFTPNGKGFFLKDFSERFFFLAILNSSFVTQMADFLCGLHKQRGDVELIGIPTLNSFERSRNEDAAKHAIEAIQDLSTANEDSALFCEPGINCGTVGTAQSIVELYKARASLIEKTSQTIKKSFDIFDSTVKQACPWLPLDEGFIEELKVARSKILNCYMLDTEAYFSYFVGIIFGRWDIRYATGEIQPPVLQDPFAQLPMCPPGMLQNIEGVPVEPNDVPSDYSIKISWSGILVDDKGNKDDIIGRIRDVMKMIWKEKVGDVEQEACDIFGILTLREYFAKPSMFFADHLKRYSKSRRQAPIYWSLSTPSGSYTLWIYYHRLTDQTLYTCVIDFVEPKLEDLSKTLECLKRKTGRSPKEEKEIEKLTDLELELKDFKSELLRIAKFWKPNLNDGVQIIASPLWQFIQLKSWQKKLKETWDKMESGEYDWAHLAYSIWPERVIRASQKDRSYAIAHDLEDVLWTEVPKGNSKSEWIAKKLREEDIQALVNKKKDEGSL